MPSTQAVASHKPGIRPQPKVTTQANRLSSSLLDNMVGFAYTAPDRVRTLVDHCHTSDCASTSAPLAISSSATAVWPLKHAPCSGVQLLYIKAARSDTPEPASWDGVIATCAATAKALPCYVNHASSRQPQAKHTTSSQGCNSIKGTSQAIHWATR